MITKVLRSKIFIGFAIIAPLALAGQRLKQFYKENVPVAREGHCLSVKPSGEPYTRIVIIVNNQDDKESVIGIYDDKGIYAFDIMSYSEIRALSPKDAECPNEKN